MPDRLLAALAAPVTLPLSWMVAVVARDRRSRIVRQDPLARSVPVIIVGNLVAGGSGKTPLVIAIARGLAEAGFSPGLLARGYRAGAASGRGAPDTDHGVILVDRNTDPARAGDEAVLLARETGLPVAVATDRGAAAGVLRRRHPECDVIVSDDGLQHVGLARQIELLVIDDRGFGNRRCLPAGPLREPADRADSVDAIVLTAVDAVAPQGLARVFRSSLQMQRFRVLAGDAGWLPTEFAREHGSAFLSAVAGIARPERFFASLQALGLHPGCHPLPDHADIDPVWLAALPGRWILMTGKDAVKCRGFDRALLQRCVCVEVAATPDPALLTWLAARLYPTAHREG